MPGEEYQPTPQQQQRRLGREREHDSTMLAINSTSSIPCGANGSSRANRARMLPVACLSLEWFTELDVLLTLRA
jgi:hypothetical protein